MLWNGIISVARMARNSGPLERELEAREAISAQRPDHERADHRDGSMTMMLFTM